MRSSRVRKSSRAKETQGQTGLLARGFAVDINDPESSPLTDDQLKIVYVASVLDEMFREAELRPSRRNLLLRLYEEVIVSGVDDQDRRLYRGVKEIEQRVSATGAHRKKASRADSLALLLALEDLKFPVFDRRADEEALVAGLMNRCRPRSPRPKGSLSAAGVLARILINAGHRVVSESGLVKKINEAVARETKRHAKREAL